MNDVRIIGNGRYKTAWATVPHIREQHTKPGMYAEIVNTSIVDSKQYCAIVGVTENEVELLLRADSTFAKSIDDSILITTKLLGGFDISNVNGRKVVCFAAGSGISAIIPVVQSVINHGAERVDVIYLENKKEYNVKSYYHELNQATVKVHFAETQGVLSTNEHQPILGMLSELTGCQPIVYMNKPVFFACGPKGFVNRLKNALIPIYASEQDFRLNF